jgi:hypothetical protein
MNTKYSLRLGVPLGEATRRATDFVAQYVLRGGDIKTSQPTAVDGAVSIHSAKLRFRICPHR